MFNTILFDLDGTLLPMDYERFAKIYFTELGRFCEDLIVPQNLVKHIWTATHAMVANTEELTNETVFMENFARLIPGELDEYLTRFDLFYQQEFKKTRAAIFENALIPASLTLLKAKGYQLVLATNPLFPEPAILQRINWAGLKPTDFSYITTFERNHYCKPQTQYFTEILREISKTSADCLMVGNDVQEDLVATNLGISTYLITDCMINRSPEEPISSDYQGSYREFYNFVAELPQVLPATG